MKLSDTKHLVQKVSEYLKIPCIPANMLKSPQWPSLKHLRGTWDDDLDTVHLDTMVYLLVYVKHVQIPFRFQFWGFIMLLTSTHPHHLLYQVPGTSKHRHPARPLFHIVLISTGCMLPFRLWRLCLAARHGLQHMLQEVPVGPLHALELRKTVATPEPQKLLEWNKQNVCLIHAYPTLWGTLPYHIIPPKRIEHSVQESNMSGEIFPYLQYYP